MGRALVAAEVICSFFLLILSGAFVAAVHWASQVDYGVSPESYITAFVRPNGPQIQSEAERYRYLQRLQSEIISATGASAVTFATTLPGTANFLVHYAIDGDELKVDGEYPEQILVPVDHNFFQTLEVELLAGRHFNSSDTADSEPVLLVEKAFTEKVWPGESPLGKRIHLNPDNEEDMISQEWATIVGVIAHVDQGQSQAFLEGRTSVYRPLAQQTTPWAHVFVQFESLPEQYEYALKKAAASVNRDVALRMIRPLTESLFTRTKILQSMSELFVVVALIALVMAGSGIYGVVSRSVMMRTQEMGVRRALGLTDERTVRYFLNHGVLYLFVGGAIGGSGAVVACSLLAGEYPVILHSIVSVVIITSLLMVVLVLGACYLPARKMTTLEPAAALHYE